MLTAVLYCLLFVLAVSLYLIVGTVIVGLAMKLFRHFGVATPGDQRLFDSYVIFWPLFLFANIAMVSCYIFFSPAWVLVDWIRKRLGE